MSTQTTIEYGTHVLVYGGIEPTFGCDLWLCKKCGAPFHRYEGEFVVTVKLTCDQFIMKQVLE
jgi:hypothetical protein